MSNDVCLSTEVRNARIEQSDFIAERKNNRWSIKWKWSDEEPIEKSIRVPFYQGQVDKLDEKQMYMFKEEIELWIEKGYIKPCEVNRVRATYPLMPQIQMHKSTTPIRPVLNLRPLNALIKSVPNEQSNPLACGTTLRRWRCKYTQDAYYIDIKKAYLQVKVDEELQPYLCIRLPYKENEYWVMVSMPFGLSIAPKCLTEILKFCLREEGLQDRVQFYVDDGIVGEEFFQAVKKCLMKNGFTIKEPERLRGARVLGMQLNNDAEGTWRRKGETPVLKGNNDGSITRRQISSWVGELIAHYPIAGWLRSACAMLTRRVSMDVNDRSDTVTSTIVSICDDLEADLKRRGDPVHGVWKLCPEKAWTLYVDASKLAYGACLYIGDLRAEDGSWIRPKDDHRHINVAELDAVLKGLSLLSMYLKANDMVGRRKDVTLRTDN